MGQVQQRLLIAMLGLAVTWPAGARKFYRDDPLAKEPRPMQVGKPKFRKLSDYFDFFANTFAKPGEKQTPRRQIRAQGVNTLGEVPDGAWYVNRHGSRPMSLEALVRGADTGRPPVTDGPWSVVNVKSEGVTPGLVIEDSGGTRFWLKFDPLTNPEMATAADVIGSAFFYALGYHVPEYYLVRFDRKQLALTEKSTFTDELGKKRRLAERDVDEIMLGVPSLADGRYRAIASRRLPGSDIGPFRYYGTRLDDPNDIVPHEHRRDLRGLYVFCAWLGHEDSRAINTLDAVVEEDGLRYIRHHLIDFGAILGSASVKPNSARSTHEYLFAWKPAALQFFTLGFYVPHWARAHFPDLPSAGRFEYAIFDPEQFKPEYRHPAFENRLPDDAFWAARQVMRFSDEQIRAIVQKGQFSDPRAVEWLTTCLIHRRDKIGRVYFDKVLPLDRIRLERGRLEFDDLAVKYDFHPARQYSIEWFRFDNEAERKTPLAGASGPALPAELRKDEYFGAEIRGQDAKKAVTAYFRNRDGRTELVGLERTW